MLYMVDGYAGTPHITAPQVGDYNAGITGVGSCVFNVGEKLRAESVNANTVRIYDGSFLFQGYRRGGIQAGSYEDVTIENGTQDQKRNDIIAVRYEKDSASQTESFSLAVLKGTPGADGEDPSYTAGDIREGDLVCYMPLYRVRLEGINLTGLEPLFAVRKTMAELEAEVGELNDDLTGFPDYDNMSAFSEGQTIARNGYARFGCRASIDRIISISVNGRVVSRVFCAAATSAVVTGYTPLIPVKSGDIVTTESDATSEGGTTYNTYREFFPMR